MTRNRKLQHTNLGSHWGPGCVARGKDGHYLGDSENDGMSNLFTFSALKP